MLRLRRCFPTLVIKGTFNACAEKLCINQSSCNFIFSVQNTAWVFLSFIQWVAFAGKKQLCKSYPEHEMTLSFIPKIHRNKTGMKLKTKCIFFSLHS